GTASAVVPGGGPGCAADTDRKGPRRRGTRRDSGQERLELVHQLLDVAGEHRGAEVLEPLPEPRVDAAVPGAADRADRDELGARAVDGGHALEELLGAPFRSEERRVGHECGAR